MCAWAQAPVDSEADPPGKIDNSALMKQYPKFRDLREGLVEGTDFVAVSEKSWNQLNSWYGSPLLVPYETQNPFFGRLSRLQSRPRLHRLQTRRSCCKMPAALEPGMCVEKL